MDNVKKKVGGSYIMKSYKGPRAVYTLIWN